MLLELISNYAIWILAACIAGLLIGFLVIVSSYRESKRAPYMFLRDEAEQRFRQATLIFIPLFLVTVALAVVVGRSRGGPSVARLYPTPIPTPTQTPTLTLGPPSPTFTPMLSPTFTPTATVTPAAETPAPTPPLVLVAKTPSPEATFGEITFARGVTDDGSPLEPGTVFSQEVKAIYAFFVYKAMANGVPWTQVWLREGEELVRVTELWEWGTQDRARIYYKPSAGYIPGRYELRLYIGDQLQQTATFEIR